MSSHLRPSADDTAGRVPSGRALVVGAVGIMLVAANLRPAVVAVSPLLGQIRRTEHLGGAAAGMLTTLPVLCFGLMAPLAPRLGRRVGLERSVFLALMALLVGFLLRLMPTTTALLGGTVLAGSAIGFVNVLLPAVIKRDFAARAGLMTGLYSMTLSGGAAIAAGLTVPLRDATGWGWRPTLASWSVLVLLAMLMWVPLTLGTQHTPEVRGANASVLRNPIAWALTVFMGTQSLIFYTAVAWLPAYFSSRGFTDAAAGGLLSLLGLVGMLCSLVTPMVAARMPDQRLLSVATALVSLIGLVGLALAPGGALVWVCLIGAGPGAAISLALLMMVLRAAHPQQTSELSGMAQTIGYVLAAAGPFLIGVVHDASGSWSLALSVLAVFLLPQGVSGYLAGRRRTLPI